MGLINAAECILLVVDIQSKLAPHIFQADVVTANTRRLMQVAHVLEIPVMVTEHYREGLGETVEGLQDLLAESEVAEKMYFSAAREPHILSTLKASGRNNIILTGSETHVCVMQTGFGLLEHGFDVSLVRDATSSRKPFDRIAGLKRLSESGVQSLSTEMLLFEWLEHGNHAAFKDVLSIIKNHQAHWQGDY